MSRRRRIADGLLAAIGHASHLSPWFYGVFPRRDETELFVGSIIAPRHKVSSRPVAARFALCRAQSCTPPSPSAVQGSARNPETRFPKQPGFWLARNSVLRLRDLPRNCGKIQVVDVRRIPVRQQVVPGSSAPPSPLRAPLRVHLGCAPKGVAPCTPSHSTVRQGRVP